MNIVEYCANRIEPKYLAFMQTSIYWMLGREWLLKMGMSPDSWTASCLDVMKSIKAGVLSPTPEQQDNLRIAITDEGASYLLAVESAINASTQNPPGTFKGLCAFAPVPFACFAGTLATNYVLDREKKDGANRLQQVLQGNWRDPSMTASCNSVYGAQKEYQPVLPDGNPAGIDPGSAGEPPVKKDDTTTPPLDPGIPGPPPKKDDTTTPPAPAAPGYWSKWGWPLGLGAAALAVIGGVFYFGKKKASHRLLPANNPPEKVKTFEDNSGEYLTLIGTENGNLILRPSKEGIEKAKELLEYREINKRGILDDEADMLAAHMGNNWDYIRPEEVGALTDATIIAQDVQRDDSGDLVDVGRVYAHMNYAVEDPTETWAAGKDVVYQGYGADNKNPSSKDDLIYVDRIRLDEDGRDANGTYYGIGMGMPIYRVYTMDGTIDDTIQSVDKKDAKQWAHSKYPGRKLNPGI